MLRRFLPLVFAFFMTLALSPAFADSGIYVRNGFSSISSPVTGQTWVLNQADNTAYIWNGTAWEARMMPKFNLAGSGAPSTGNDNTQGYAVGSFWYDGTGQNLYICTSATASAATWKNLSGGGGSGDVLSTGSNTFTGTNTQDISASTQTLKIPTKTDPGTPAVKEIWLSGSTGALLKFRDNAGTPVTHIVVDTARQVLAGTGLTGGGNLGADVTIALATPVAKSNLPADAVYSARAVNTGTGLTGGGDLSADRTIALVTPVAKSNLPADTVYSARNVAVGTGLSGGGDLSADRTISLTTPVAAGNLPATIAYTNVSNTFTGTNTQDLSASGQTVKLPTKTDPGSPSTSEMWLSGTTGTTVKFRDNAGTPATHSLADAARQVATGTGLTGGGDLSADRTIALVTPVAKGNLPADAVYSARQLIAGTGLSGGGDLTADRTISLAVPVTPARGGTGSTTAPTTGQIPTGDGTGNYTPNTLSAGSNVTIDSSTTPGTIVISATPGGGGGNVSTTTSNTYTGTHTQDISASGQSLKIPTKTDPGTPLVEEVWLSGTTGTKLKFQDNAGTPATHEVVDTTSTQTLTGKSIAGSEINSGTVPLAQMDSTVSTASNTQTLTNKSIDGSEINSGTVADARLNSDVVITTATQTLTNKSIDGAEINSGTVTDSRLSSNVPLKNASNTFTGTNTNDFSASGQVVKLPTKSDPGTPAVSEVWLSGATGTKLKFQDNAGTPATHEIVDTTSTQTLTGKSIAGSEINSGTVPLAQMDSTVSTASNTQTLTNKSIDGSEINSGTVADARLNSDVVITTATQTLTNKSISGSQINSGTVPLAQLPAGTNNQLLTTLSGAAAYQFGLMGFQASNTTATLTTASPSYNTIDTTSGAVNLTLPAASTCKNKIFWFEQIAGSNTLTVTADTTAPDLIEASATISPVQLEIVGMMSDGVSRWRYLKPLIGSLASGGTGANLNGTGGVGGIVYSASSTAMGVTAAPGANQLAGVVSGIPGYVNGLSGTAALTSNTTLTVNSASLETIDSTGGAVTVTLPSAATSNGKIFLFKPIAGTNSQTVSRAGSDTIDGATSITLDTTSTAPTAQVTGVASDGTTVWRVIKRPIIAGTNATVTNAAGGTTIAATSGGGSGTVNSGTANQVAKYVSTGAAVSGDANHTITNGDLVLGGTGVQGSLTLNGPTSGTVQIKPTAAAGTGTIVTLPASNSNTVIPSTLAAHNFANQITASGLIAGAQPASSDLTDASNIALVNNANNFSVAQLPSASGTVDLGSTTKNFRDIFLGGSSFYNRITSTTPTSNRICTLPDAASNTVQPLGSASGSNFVQWIGADGTQHLAVPAGGGGATIGGDGSAGAVTKGAVTETTPQQWNATTFTQTVSTTYTVKSGTIVNSTGACTINGTMTTTADMPGSDSTGILGAGNPAHGLGAGANSPNNAQGSSGGAFGGTGGRDGGSTCATTQAIGLGFGYCGSGGGCGTGTVNNQGGNGGGYVRFCNSGTGVTIAAGGTIASNGTAGAVSGSGNGGAGGSGGGVYIYSTVSITTTGAITANGGASPVPGSGNSSGGGGGGYIVRHSPSNTGAGTATCGGAASGSNGAVGGTGVVLNITGTPCYPLIAEHQRQYDDMVATGWIASNHKSGHEAPMFTIARLKGDQVAMTQKEHVTFLAALKATDPDSFRSICYEFNNGEQMDGVGRVATLYAIGDANEVLNAA